ncbi:MAG: metallophosphoesterase [Lachnospiraceae bacterium]|nr:metallophosphoesterase [Lachnospiraceae bacterium]
MIEFVLWGGVFLVLLLIGVIICDTHRFVTKETTFLSGNIKKDMTVVVLSDLHNKTFGKENRKLIAAIEKAHPDLILIAGDMLNAHPGADFSGTVSFLKTLAEKYKVIYGIGNHEHRLGLYPEVYGSMHQDYWEAVKHENIIPLVNEKIEFEKYGICIYGSQIDKWFYKRFKVQKMEANYLKTILGEPNPGNFNILLAHNPDYFEKYSEWGADLVLSGHVHGGIVRIPFLGGVLSPACRLFPKYDGGIFHKQRCTMLLSRGLGTHTIPVRLFNPGELHVVYLKADR